MPRGQRARTLGAQLEIAGPPPTTKSFKAAGSMPPRRAGAVMTRFCDSQCLSFAGFSHAESRRF
jgi:hypothetical protein